MDAAGTDSWIILPLEVIFVIFDWLQDVELGMAFQVCRKWRRVSQEDYFWKSRCARYRLDSIGDFDSWRHLHLSIKTIVVYRDIFRIWCFPETKWLPVDSLVYMIRISNGRLDSVRMLEKNPKGLPQLHRLYPLDPPMAEYSPGSRFVFRSDLRTDLDPDHKRSAQSRLKALLDSGYFFVCNPPGPCFNHQQSLILYWKIHPLRLMIV
jgi:hypothetical protein